MTVTAGDVIECRFGVHGKIDRVTVHRVHTYPSGAMSIRFRYFDKGIDWSGFIEANEPTLRIVGHVAPDPDIRSLLP